MSGHSKWHNIRVRKEKQDAERGKLFTKLMREIIVAAREGGGNPDVNIRLRLAIAKAKESGMPSDNIKRAIQRGTGELEGTHYEEVAYEGYGPGGIAILVDAMTDNRNRTVSEMRRLFAINGGKLSEAGGVAWLFDKKGLIVVEKEKVDEDTLITLAIDAGAEDIKSEDNTFEIVTAPENFEKVKKVLSENNIEVSIAEVTMVPKNTIKITGKEAQQILRLMDALEDHDDVQRVYANFDIPDEVLEAAAA